MLVSENAAVGGFFYLVPWVVLLPAIGVLINTFFGGWLLLRGVAHEAHEHEDEHASHSLTLGEKLVGGLASLAAGSAFVVAVLLGVSLLGHPEGVTYTLANWITAGGMKLDWAFRVDTLSVTMMLVVSGVGTLIHIYAVGYMHEDVRHNGDPSRYRRFFVFLNLFIAMMMILVSADNYIMLFVGWEGVGLCSYLLIGFWYDKGKNGIGNAIAAKKAFIANRVGDFGFLIAMFLMFWAFNGQFSFQEVNLVAPTVAKDLPNLVLAMTLFMLLGVAGKSAQLPLYVWLPDAMAGPTPVSALIHAATMVTAGVYLIARSYAIYSLVPAAQNIVALVGAVTALFAATIALGQFDIKKVLAYSTISQLGFMVAAVGMGAFTAGMFHLVTHAFFKALLFLSAGSVILGMEAGHHHVEHDPHLKRKLKSELVKVHTAGQHFDPQDMRNMGGLRERMPVTFWVYLIGALALAGIVPFAGFWSKDEILAEALHLHPVVYWLLTIAAIFTAFYMGRQVLMVFFGEARTEPAAHADENPPIVTLPLVILAILSVIGGFMNLPVRGLSFFATWLEHTIPLKEAAGAAASEGAAAAGPLITLNWFVAILSTLLAIGAIAGAWYLYRRVYPEQQSLPLARRPDDPLRGYLGPVFTVLENKYWVDELYKVVILDRYVDLSRFLAEVIDWRFWHDWFHDVILAGGYRLLSRVLAVQIDLGGIDRFANGLADGTKWAAAQLRRIQTGYVRNYAIFVFVGMVVILGYLILR